MIGVELAERLKGAGLSWKPALGDRFAIPDRDLDDEVFVLSNMTIQVHTLPEGQVVGFNGTTEWALDDVELEETIWLPREDQLRELLGGTFRGLRRESRDSRENREGHENRENRESRDPAGYEVTIDLLGEERRFGGGTADEAYAEALLHLLAAAGLP